MRLEVSGKKKPTPIDGRIDSLVGLIKHFSLPVLAEGPPSLPDAHSSAHPPNFHRRVVALIPPLRAKFTYCETVV